MLDLIASFLVRGLNLLLHIIPIGFTLRFGRMCGVLFCYFTPYRKRIGYANLRAAYSGEKTPQELKKMIIDVYKSLGETFAEILALTKLNAKYIEKYIDIKGMENFHEAVKHGKGVIFLSGHYGNWELSGMVSSIKGYPLYVLAREQKMKRLNELINRLRESKGSKVIRKGFTTRYLVKALHENKMIGMVADQDVGKNGMLADFFGRPTATADGPYRIAKKTGAVLLPAFSTRIKGPYYRLYIEDPIKLSENDQIYPALQKYNKTLESYVRKHNSQWLWIHRRWKSTPLKKIVILSDGKQGHLNQSLALAELFKKYRTDKGIKEHHTEVKVVDIRFKSKIAKNILNISSLFSGKQCQGCQKCLKFALTEKSYSDLTREYADAVVSTGFSLASVNSIFRYENNSKNAVSMKPGFLGMSKFNMVVMPRHDISSFRKRKNVMIADIAPNIVTDEYLKKSSEKIIGSLKYDNSKKTIGILFGGDNKNYYYKQDDVESVLDRIANVSAELDAQMLCTTSRRSSVSHENMFKEKLSGNKRCKLMVIANKKNIPDAVGGILSLSDVLIVSGESISMVSEAISSGKKVIIFKGSKKIDKKNKHDAFITRCQDAGYINIADKSNVDTLIKNSFSDDKSSASNKDRDWIYSNMWRLGA